MSFLDHPLVKELEINDHIHAETHRDENIHIQLTKENEIFDFIYKVNIDGETCIVKVFEDEHDDFEDRMRSKRAIKDLRCVSHLDYQTIRIICELMDKDFEKEYPAGTKINYPCIFMPLMSPQKIKSNESGKKSHRGVINKEDFVSENYPLVEFMNGHLAYKLKDKCPHFLGVYSFSIDTKPFRQLMVMEKMQDEVENRLSEMSSDEIIQILFRIIYTLGILWKELKMVHGDVHLSNIFLTFVDKEDGVDTYIVNDTVFELPKLRFEIKLADYGFSSKWVSPKVLRTDIIYDEVEDVPNFPTPIYDTLFLCQYTRECVPTLYKSIDDTLFLCQYTRECVPTLYKSIDDTTEGVINYIKKENNLKPPFFDRNCRPYLCREMADAKTTPFDVLLYSGVFDIFRKM